MMYVTAGGIGQDEEIVNSTEGSGGLVVLAVDDEKPALDELEYLLGQDQRIGTVLTASNANDALRMLSTRERPRDGLPGMASGQVPVHPVTGAPIARSTDVDVVFLDIRMPGLDGLELARVFSSMVVPPAVVFVTAHDDRAVDAFDVGAVDYLLKPLRSERLRGSLDRILSSRVVASNDSGGSDGANDDEVIPVELAGTTKLVPRSAVRYVEAQGDYARLHTAFGSHLVRVPLSALAERWADAGFVRIHRSTLVSLTHVDEVRVADGRCSVRLGNDELPVSRRHTRELRDRVTHR
jgi:DNA-binding LytR/AlgR family response regulator